MFPSIQKNTEPSAHDCRGGQSFQFLWRVRWGSPCEVRGLLSRFADEKTSPEGKGACYIKALAEAGAGGGCFQGGEERDCLCLSCSWQRLQSLAEVPKNKCWRMDRQMGGGTGCTNYSGPPNLKPALFCLEASKSPLSFLPPPAPSPPLLRASALCQHLTRPLQSPLQHQNRRSGTSVMTCCHLRGLCGTAERSPV